MSGNVASPSIDAVAMKMDLSLGRIYVYIYIYVLNGSEIVGYGDIIQ